MDRRSFLAAAGTTSVGVAGCVGGKRVLVEIQRELQVEPGVGWTRELPAVDGSAVIRFTARAEKRFDVFYFVDPAAFAKYEAYLQSDDPDRMPTGHDRLTKTAVPRDGTDGYEVVVPTDGKHAAIGADGSHHIALDYSDYGTGMPVADPNEPLRVFLDLSLLDKQLPI